jgi:hypothetical protein
MHAPLAPTLGIALTVEETSVREAASNSAQEIASPPKKLSTGLRLMLTRLAVNGSRHVFRPWLIASAYTRLVDDAAGLPFAIVC